MESDKHYCYKEEDEDGEPYLYVSETPIEPEHEMWSSIKTVMNMQCDKWPDDENPDGDYINTGMVHVDGGNLIKIKNLSIINSPDEAISIRSQSSNIILSGNEISESYSSSINTLYDVSNVLIEKNNMSYGCAGSKAENTTISRAKYISVVNNSYGITYNDAGVDTYDNTSDVAIVDNKMIDVINGAYIAGKNIRVTSNIINGSERAITAASENGDPVSNIIISNNMVSNSTSKGIWLGQYCDSDRTSGVTCDQAITEDVFITNNTLVNNTNGITISRTTNEDGKYEKIYVKNNIISKGETGLRFIKISDTYDGSIDDKLTLNEMLGNSIFIENNLKWCYLDKEDDEFVATDDEDNDGINDCFHYGADEYIEYVSKEKGTIIYSPAEDNEDATERTDLYVDPIFTNTDDGVFHINRESSAFKKGTPFATAFQNFDFKGDRRQTNCFDIGANEDSIPTSGYISNKLCAE